MLSGNARGERHPEEAYDPIGSLSAVSGTFNTFFKVLFIFPSRYFFAIGLTPVFSLMRKLPHNLRFNPKKHDSMQAYRRVDRLGSGYGIVTLCDVLSQETWHPATTGNAAQDHKSVVGNDGFSLWALPCSLAVTRGIMFIFFSST